MVRRRTSLPVRRARRSLVLPSAAVFGAAAVASVIASTTPAYAAGYSSARFGGDQGSPALATPFAVYFNPAAMGGSPARTQIVLDGSLALRQVTYTRSPSALSPDDPNRINEPLYKSANTGDATLFNVVPAPFLGAMSNLGTKNLRVGYAGYIPFGGSSDWSKNDKFAGSSLAPGAVDGPQRWANVSGQIIAFYNTLALSYTFEKPHLTLGASFSGIYHSVKSVRARNADGSDDLTSVAGSLKEGRSYLAATGFNLGATLGVYWENEDRKLRIGASYISQPGFGETRLKGTLEQQFGTDSSRAQVTTIDLLQSYPDVIRLGGAFRYSDQWEIRADAAYSRWSKFKYQCVVKPGEKCDVNADGSEMSGNEIVLNVPRKWKDTIYGRAGLAYFVGQDTELFGSLGFETSAVPVRLVDPAAIDAFRIDVSLGGKYNISDHVSIAASANYLYYLPVETNGTAEQYRYAGASRSPSADGDYQAAILFFNAHVIYGF